MEKISKNEKRNLRKRFLEFKKSGLESYDKYLHNEYERDSKSDYKKLYVKYLVKEMERTKKKLEKIDAKLSSGD